MAAGDEVVITRRSTSVARLIAEPSISGQSPHDWAQRLRRLHGDHSGETLQAVCLVHELRELRERI